MTWARSRRPVWARQISYALFVWLVLAIAPARANVSVLENAAAPVVRVNIREGPVTIRTWDRDAVQIDADPSVVVTRKPYRAGTSLGSLPISATGRPESDTFLPGESFVPGAVPPGSRDSILIHSDVNTAPGPVVVTVPSDSPLVFAIARGGSLSVQNYRAGTFVGITTAGRLSVENGGGTVFLQSGRGAITVNDSTFDRIRVRSLAGNVTYERCVVHQIETTAIGGSIVFDGGSFQPGLARFESVRGNVAIGSESAAELSARSATGRAYTSFQNHASVDERGGESHVTIGGGGPVVTAASERGNVYLYDGSLRTRTLPPPWQAPTETLERPGRHRIGPRPGGAYPPQTSQRKYRMYDFPHERNR